MKFFIDESHDGQKLCNFLKKQSIPFSMINKLLRTKQIKINDSIISSNINLKNGDKIEIFAKLEIEKKPNLEKDLDELYEKFKSMIIFENKDLIAINKPDHLAVQLGTKVKFCVETLMNAYTMKLSELNKSSGSENYPKVQKLRIVHRIDKDTSGILLIAKTIDSARKLTKAFEDKLIHKTYFAILSFTDKQAYNSIQSFGTIVNKLKKQTISGEELVVVSNSGDEAITDYEVVKKLNHRYILIKFMPLTGRTHQLRVHSKTLGGYILGDQKYALQKDNEKHLHLNASQVVINKKVFGHEITINIPLPDFFKNKL